MRERRNLAPEMDERPEPDRRRGPPRPLSQRASRYAEQMAATDRGERFSRRLERVSAIHRSRHRRRGLTEALSWTLLAALVVGAGAWLGGGVGLLVGGGLLLLSVVTIQVARRLARRRGATAWDWQLQRHRLLGNPSEEVRRRDPPKGPGIIGRG